MLKTRKENFINIYYVNPQIHILHKQNNYI